VKLSSDIPKNSSMNVIPESPNDSIGDHNRESDARNSQSPPVSKSPSPKVLESPVTFSDVLSATVERIRIKREERVRTAPHCSVCGNSILADEPSHSPDIEEWTLYNATHEKLCFKHFQIEYAKIKLNWRNNHADKSLVAAGVSEEFSNRSFENYVVTDTNKQFFTAVKDWAEHPKSFLAILSPHTGIGKTHLAIAALRRFYIDTGRIGKFRKEGPFLLDIRKGYSTYGAFAESDAIESLSKPDFLVYDDLFSSRDPHEGIEFPRRIALAVLDEREWQGRITVVTSNLTLSGIATIDQRISSRLSGGLVLNVQSVDEDFRPKLYKPALSLSKLPALSDPERAKRVEGESKGQKAEAPNE
jgi:DNA replication protein DnaC